jgi:hypothetical protein
MNKKCEKVPPIITRGVVFIDAVAHPFTCTHWGRELDRRPPEYLIDEKIVFAVDKIDAQYFKHDDCVMVAFPTHDIDKQYFVMAKKEMFTGNCKITLRPAYVLPSMDVPKFLRKQKGPRGKKC